MSNFEKLMPSSVIRQLKATAALQCYDFIFQEDAMKKQDQERRAYNFFHGNSDRNVISQVDLLLKGHGNYERIFDRKFNMVIDLNQDWATAGVSSQNSMLSLVIKDYFTSVDETNRYVSDKHFTKNTICAPSKTKSDENITGRAVIDLAKLCLRNIKKQWLEQKNI